MLLVIIPWGLHNSLLGWNETLYEQVCQRYDGLLIELGARLYMHVLVHVHYRLCSLGL